LAFDTQRTQLWQEDALGRHTPVEPFWAHYSRPLTIRFPAANTQTDIAHQLGVLPTGYLVIFADSVIRATPGKLWTDQIAYLQADTANGRAVIIFFTTREEPLNVAP
jgi:hypothetical protein